MIPKSLLYLKIWKKLFEVITVKIQRVSETQMNNEGGNNNNSVSDN